MLVRCRAYNWSISETNREERYHKVSQDSSDGGICCSVNYCRLNSREVCFIDAHRFAGYDMDFEGTFYASNVFVRDLAWASTRLNNAS